MAKTRERSDSFKNRKSWAETGKPELSANSRTNQVQASFSRHVRSRHSFWIHIDPLSDIRAHQKQLSISEFRSRGGDWTRLILLNRARDSSTCRAVRINTLRCLYRYRHLAQTLHYFITGRKEASWTPAEALIRFTPLLSRSWNLFGDCFTRTLKEERV